MSPTRARRLIETAVQPSTDQRSLARLGIEAARVTSDHHEDLTLCELMGLAAEAAGWAVDETLDRHRFEGSNPAGSTLWVETDDQDQVVEAGGLSVNGADGPDLGALVDPVDLAKAARAFIVAHGDW